MIAAHANLDYSLIVSSALNALSMPFGLGSEVLVSVEPYFDGRGKTAIKGGEEGNKDGGRNGQQKRGMEGRGNVCVRARIYIYV